MAQRPVMIQKLLIANRGEIACRIIRTAKHMGIATVAVYSEFDRNALHARLAGEAVAIGPAAASESYLNMEKLVGAARSTKADAIHPGYGFLSENPAFAQACAAAGVTFVGPPAAAIEAMGSKTKAKRLMEHAGVPVLPGYHGGEQSVNHFQQEAAHIGYPVLLKAAAGGGGKGMRIVETAEQLAEAFAGAQREAAKSFGDNTLLLEKLLKSPRHVEVQVFCDAHGNGIYLSERDCSIQRRYQKVIEEAPAPGIDSALRAKLGETAVRAAQAIDYVGAGTIEFLLDADGRFYFMEMNTRLQVEHPVTEMITGLDLVAWQLRIAAGGSLPLKQEQITLGGHAIEARLCAEDPYNDFLPATGHIDFLRSDEQNAGIRIDGGIQEGDDIGVHYDPLLAKLIAWGEHRQHAQQRLRAALDRYLIAGIKTNRDVLRAILAHPAFTAGDVNTHFLADYPEVLLRPKRDITPALLAAAVVQHHRLERDNDQRAARSGDASSPWWSIDGWRAHKAEPLCFRFEQEKEINERESHALRIAAQSANRYQLAVADHCVSVEATVNQEQLTLVSGDKQSHWIYTVHNNKIHLFESGNYFCLEHVPLEQAWDPSKQNHATEDRVTAPMSGTVVALAVESGTEVTAGQVLLTLEAMKMEHNLRAPRDGTIAAIQCKAGDLVSGGQELLLLESS